MNSEEHHELKFRFEIATLPTILLVKGEKYAQYTKALDQASLLAFVQHANRETVTLSVPPAKSALEKLLVQVRWNAEGIGRAADMMGLGSQPLWLKVTISFGILFLPILLAYLYAKHLRAAPPPEKPASDKKDK